MDPSLADVTREHQVVFRKDRHLSSALIISEIEYMFAHKDNPRALKEEHRMLLRDVEGLSLIHPRYVYSWMMNNYKDIPCHNHSPELRESLKAALQAVNISLANYHERDFNLTTTSTQLITTLYAIKEEFDNVFKKITFSTSFKQKWNIGTIRGTAYGNLHLMRLNSKEHTVITHSHLAGLKDMFNSWFSVLIYALNYQNKYNGLNLYDEIVDTINKMAVFSKCNIDMMSTVLKVWPSVAISVILRDTENSSEFYDSLMKSLISVADTPLIRKWTSPILSEADVHLRLELSGLWKCFGHPIIDMDSSVKAWIDKAACLKLNLEHQSVRLLHMFVSVFCRNYYRQKRCWPPCELSSTVRPHIKHNYMNGSWNEDPKYPWVSSDFEGVTIQECLIFNYHIDISDLLSDKSIIPKRSEWIHKYDKQAHRTIHGRFPFGPAPTTRSAVISYLKTKEVSVKSIIETIESRVIPLDWRVTVCVAKEREQKDKNARFFAKLTPSMRLYQTATESNLAESVFPYLPQQTMTMSEEQLLRLLQRMTNPRLDTYSQDFRYVVIDFSSWCTNHRYELCDQVFRQLDKLFGLDFTYQFTHIYTLMSVVLFQDRFNPPAQDEVSGDPLPGGRCYHGAEAWQEGLRQKGWTILTMMLINLVAERCGTSATLIGQGDNQVVLIRIPPPNHLANLGMNPKTYVDWFVNELERESDACGLVIKSDETWRSRHLFEYSREYFYKGSQVSAALKRISRLASEANQTLPTLTRDLSSIYSTGSSAAGKDHYPVPSFIVTSLEAILLIRRSFLWLRQAPLECSVAALLVGRLLGGLPVGLYDSFCTRGTQDYLSASLRLLKTAAKYPDIRRHLSVWLSRGFGKADWETLIKDPQSLPLNIPRNPEARVRQEVKEGIPSIVENLTVKALFDSDMDKHKENLIRDLSSIKPSNPRLLNKLYSLSNLGLQERYIGKYANTRSIQQLAFKTWSNEKDLLDWISMVESSISATYESRQGPSISFLLSRVESNPCTTSLAHELRYEGWGSILEGVTMGADPEMTTLHRWESVPTEWRSRTILIQVDQYDNALYPPSKGKRSAYFGSNTQLRARKAPLQVMEIGSMVSSIKQLMELRGWMKNSPGLTHLIDKLIAEKTPEQMDKLLMYSRDVYGGTLSHRLDCPGLRRGAMLNQTANLTTHITILSDTATEYAKKGENFTICFQASFLRGISALTQLAYLGEDITGAWG